MTGGNDSNEEDVGWWDCSLCTYRNSADKFKCEICDLRRGTSTRKPRCSNDTIVAQVMKQQEQIQQRTKTVAKPAPKSKTPKEKKKEPAAAVTPEPTTSSPQNSSQSSTSSTITNVSTSSSTTSIDSLPPTSSTETHSTKKPVQSHDNPVKVRPVKINGNLIKYLPPVSTGRTGLIIDKKRFTQHSVTVYDVTITFTEFATRQNKYVRKKKKKSGKAAGSNPSTAGANVESKS